MSSSFIDFSGIVSGAGVQLEQAAFNLFGAAVDQYTNQSLNQSVFNGEYPQESYPPSALGAYVPANYTDVWRQTNYAQDLIHYQPKHRFMFRVLFEMDPSFTELTGRKNIFQYVIKQVDKPKLSFDYEEVNMYNFRTKVLKTIHHDPLSITMIDDIKDTFHDFFKQYLRAYSPATRSWNSSQSVRNLEDSGFNFSEPGSTSMDSAVRGVLKDGKSTPLKSIKLIQYFGHAEGQNTFVFVNPRILDVTFDEAHHEGGDLGNHATLRFDYDILFIEDEKPFTNRSEYSAPYSDLDGAEMEWSSLHQRGGNPNFLGSPNSFGSFYGGQYGNQEFDGPFTSIIKGTIGGVVGSVVNGVSSKVLGGITNPFLNNAARRVIWSPAQAVQRTATNTLFGSINGRPSSPTFQNPVIED